LDFRADSQPFDAFHPKGCNQESLFSLLIVSRMEAAGLINQIERRRVMKGILFRCQIVGLLAAAIFYGLHGMAQEQKEQKAHAVNYTVTDLGLIGPSPGPVAITNDGLISESVAVSNEWHAAISFLGSTPIDLTKAGGLGGPNSAAFGMNELGQATGEAETAATNKEDFCGYGTQHVCAAFLWQNDVMRQLPLLKDEHGVAGRNAVARDINIWGEVAGSAENTTLDTTCPPYDPALLQFQSYQFEPVVWTRDEIRKLPTYGKTVKGNAFQDPDGVAFRINDSGLAVGATGTCNAYSFSYLNAVHATVWQNGSLIDLGNLGATGPQPPLFFGNFAYNVNRKGQVVGTSDTSSGMQHAFFWSPETHIQDVGTIPGDVASVGLSISDFGMVGGVSFPAASLATTPTASPRAFIQWGREKPRDLNSLVTGDTSLYLFSVCSINARGEIVGMATDADGNFHGFLAIPSS
jgi:probable HAF family extracellular repeat protein